MRRQHHKEFRPSEQNPSKNDAINSTTLSKKILKPVPDQTSYPSYEKGSGGPGTDTVGVLAPPPSPSHLFIHTTTREIHNIKTT